MNRFRPVLLLPFFLSLSSICTGQALSTSEIAFIRTRAVEDLKILNSKFRVFNLGASNTDKKTNAAFSSHRGAIINYFSAESVTVYNDLNLGLNIGEFPTINTYLTLLITEFPDGVLLEYFVKTNPVKIRRKSGNQFYCFLPVEKTIRGRTRGGRTVDEKVDLEMVFLVELDENEEFSKSFFIEAIRLSDLDDDGITDRNDACPEEAGLEKFRGCPDSDGDGVEDSKDECPSDPLKTKKGVCGCGVADSDRDGDKIPDCIDNCPDDPQKGTPGNCGCGKSDSDRDQDRVVDCLDGCPDDKDKKAPGFCGCGKPDVDTDGDGVLDCLDRCPKEAGSASLKGCPDRDRDGIVDLDDLCPDRKGSQKEGCPTDFSAFSKNLFHNLSISASLVNEYTFLKQDGERIAGIDNSYSIFEYTGINSAGQFELTPIKSKASTDYEFSIRTGITLATNHCLGFGVQFSKTSFYRTSFSEAPFKFEEVGEVLPDAREYFEYHALSTAIIYELQDEENLVSLFGGINLKFPVLFSYSNYAYPYTDRNIGNVNKVIPEFILGITVPIARVGFHYSPFRVFNPDYVPTGFSSRPYANLTSTYFAISGGFLLKSSLLPR
ncbi:MAG: thrombospondin type 3 repeat-containing protein [Saprospirales bacterium]|nr:thrombospondin type 3 repeat-containing protein [Saprospirales bacterium]